MQQLKMKKMKELFRKYGRLQAKCSFLALLSNLWSLRARFLQTRHFSAGRR
jgi:hypothetical protein